MKKRLACALPH